MNLLASNAVGARTPQVYEFTRFQSEHSCMAQAFDIAVEPSVMELYAHCAYASAVVGLSGDGVIIRIKLIHTFCRAASTRCR